MRRTGARAARPFDRRISIPHGPRGTKLTIDQMRRLAAKGGRDFLVRLFVLEEVLGGVKGRDHMRIAQRIFDWVQDKGSGERSGVKFVNDPHRVETVQEPWLTLLVTGAGDCNSAHATAVAGMLMSVGVPAGFRTVAADPRRPGSMSHVYALAIVRGKKIAMDTSVPFTTIGAQPARITAVKDWVIDVDSYVEDDWGSGLIDAFEGVVGWVSDLLGLED